MRHLLLVLMLFLAACERVVDVDLEEGPVRLVVEGRFERVLDRVSGSQVILLSTTGPYFSNASPPPARGAVVRVSDDAGRVVSFTESAPGRYTTTSLVVERDRRYTLQIDWQGDRYESVETTQTVVPIDSLYFDKPKPGRFAGTEGVRATIDLRDPGNVRNYYLWDQYVNGARVLGPDTTFKYRIAASDDGFDGILIAGFQPYEGIDIPVGATVTMRQIGLSEQMFRYYFAFAEQVSADGSVFAAPPSSLRGNVSNRTNRDRYPIGYFYVSEVAERTAVRR